MHKGVERGLRRAAEVAVCLLVLAAALPLLVLVAVAIKLDSPGPVFYRCRRVGHHGVEFAMLKFRKMRDDARGARLTSADDERFTRVGRFLAASKLDELPQLWNVVRGDMSLVGPRPEDAYFVDLHAGPYREILAVRPGITGLSQLAFACESDLLERDDSLDYYLDRLLPQKLAIDRLYARRRSIKLDLLIVWWTLLAVVCRRSVAVNRANARLTIRRRPNSPAAAPARPRADRVLAD